MYGGYHSNYDLLRQYRTLLSKSKRRWNLIILMLPIICVVRHCVREWSPAP
jgi:hypothetical protein